mmetsp:Transcript_25318/g.88378  ORF Transcript_25318/g.88378 Transcript_25318/m.88378 type:complete len:205 (+) Transcript_25318:275-889(+)
MSVLTHSNDHDRMVIWKIRMSVGRSRYARKVHRKEWNWFSRLYAAGSEGAHGESWMVARTCVMLKFMAMMMPSMSSDRSTYSASCSAPHAAVVSQNATATPTTVYTTNVPTSICSSRPVSDARVIFQPSAMRSIVRRKSAVASADAIWCALKSGRSTSGVPPRLTKCAADSARSTHRTMSSTKHSTCTCRRCRRVRAIIVAHAQ